MNTRAADPAPIRSKLISRLDRIKKSGSEPDHDDGRKMAVQARCGAVGAFGFLERPIAINAFVPCYWVEHVLRGFRLNQCLCRRFVGLVAGTVSGIVGTGSSIMLVPVLVLAYGPKQAVPIMAVASLMANIAKILAWWREVDWRACFAYSVTGIPAAALGAKTLLVLPTRSVDLTLGVFFILMIPVGRWLNARNYRLNLWHLGVAGAAIGFLTGIVASTGPMSVPAFASYGLVKVGDRSGQLAVDISE